MGLDWQKAIGKAALTALIVVLVSFAGTTSVYAQVKPTHKKKVLETKEAQSYPKNTKFKGRKRPPRKRDHHNERKEVNPKEPGSGSLFKGLGKKRREKGGKLPKKSDRPDFGGEMPRSQTPQGNGSGYRGGRKWRRQQTNDKPVEPAKGPVFDGKAGPGRQYPTQGTNYQGNTNRRRKNQPSPGTKHAGDIDVLSLPKNDMYQQQKKTTYLKYEKKKGPARGTRFSGDISQRALKPPKGHGGSEYEGDLKLWKQPAHDYTPGTVYQGDLRRKKNRQAKGTEYEGDMKLWKQPAHDYTPGTVYRGNLNRKDYKPDLKNQKDMANYTGTVRARSEKQKDRYYKKLSGKMSTYTGDFKIKRRKYKDMHPSASHRYAKNITGQQNRERFRKFRLWWTGLWKKSEQPDAVTEKERKPRYDRGESEIWNY
ncbi:hypothetical protein AB9P05_10495 [Roseivirga sp. BDSF3-8]|uniref:hypothetical protein n=1 Tax=Roseivirga sp. BDSF3-8 TaxID=3241598 RepID=UPI00353220B3